MNDTLLRTLPAAALLLALPAGGLATGGRLHSGGTVLSAEPVPGQVVVRAADPPAHISTPEGLLRRVERSAAPVPREAALYRLEAPSPLAAGRAARAAAHRPDIAWASPVYRIGGVEAVVTGRVLAAFPPGTDVDGSVAAVGLRPLRRETDGSWVLEGHAGSGPDLLEAAARLVEEGDAEWAHPDLAVRFATRLVPSDPFYAARQWHLDNTGQNGGTPDIDVDAPEAWDVMPADAPYGHPDVILAIVDTGVLRDHVDLASGMWTNPDETPANGVDDDGNGYIDDVYGWDYEGGDADPGPDDLCWDAHGTSVAGVAASPADNGEGVAGACGACRVLAIRLSSGAGSAIQFSDIAAAFRYAADEGAAAINNSWGLPGLDWLPDNIRLAMDHAVDQGRGGRGTAIFWASGNSHPDSVDDDPLASYPRVIAVGAVTDGGRRAFYSQTGESLDLVAPSHGGASDIFTTTSGAVRLGNCEPASYTGTFGGTSSASPLAAGVGGLLLSAVPAVHPEKLQAILEANADRAVLRPAWEPVQHGEGMVRAAAAVEDVMSGPTFDRLSYECGGRSIVLSVRDAAAAGSVAAVVSSGRDTETVACDEVTGRPGLFEGVLPTGWSETPAAEDGTLTIGPGDTLTASYAGIEDAASATCADASCAFPPEFAGLERVEDGADCSGEGPTLHWEEALSWGGGTSGVYNVYASNDPAFEPRFWNLRFTVSPPATSWTDILAQPGETWHYVVRAESDEAGCGGPSLDGVEEDNLVRWTGTAGSDTGPVPEVVPALRLARAPAAGTRFSWGLSAGADAYDLYRGSFTGAPLTFAPACFAADLADPLGATDPETPAAGTGFYYLVAAENTCGTSEFGPADVSRTAPPACP